MGAPKGPFFPATLAAILGCARPSSPVASERAPPQTPSAAPSRPQEPVTGPVYGVAAIPSGERPIGAALFGGVPHLALARGPVDTPGKGTRYVSVPR